MAELLICGESLEELINRQNKSTVVASIPATFLRVTVEFEEEIRGQRS